MHAIIKSSQYTGGDFMFLCLFVCRSRRQLQILVHVITFEQFWGFHSFLARLLALTYKLPDWILVDFHHDLDLEFSRSNIEFVISLLKLSDCHKTKSKHVDWTLGLKCDHQIWPWPWPWAWIFKVKYGICYMSTKKGSSCHETKSNHINWTPGLKCDQWVWPWPWCWHWIFKVKRDLDHFVTKLSFKDLPDRDQGDFRCRHAVDSSSYHI